AEECLERLKEPAGSARVGEDVSLEALVGRIGRRKAYAEQLDLPAERPARPVVLEIRIDGRAPDDGRPIPTYVEDSRHCLSRNEIDGQDAHGVAVGHSQGGIRSAEIKAK